MGLFKNAQMQGAQKAHCEAYCKHTLSGAVCSATQQMSVFQQHSQSLKIAPVEAEVTNFA
jgi:hypothetical protein